MLRGICGIKSVPVIRLGYCLVHCGVPTNVQLVPHYYLRGSLQPRSAPQGGLVSAVAYG
jgi:hypothetical protein